VNGTVAYILMGYPRVSETFIASEILRVERAGVPLRLFVIKPVEASERGHRHPVADAIAARPVRLPDPSPLRMKLHRWRPRHVRPFANALARGARRHPRGTARATVIVLARLARDPRKVYVRELLQAAALADALPRDVRHLHAHFAHGTTTIAWLAATIAGLPFSFTGHAKDIYSSRLNGKGWLRRKLLAARFVVTCTEANVRHLRAIAPEARVHLVYHGLSADFTRLLANQAPAPARNGHLQVLGVGRLVAKKGFDVLVDACAVLRDRGVPFEARIVGQDDAEGEALRRRIAAHGLQQRVTLAGATGPEGLLREYRGAGALCMPCRLLPDDRDGIPNVLVEAMAAGAPVVATNVSGIPELIEHEVNGLLVEPEQPEALADALIRLHADPRLTTRLTANARATVRERFDGDRLARDLAALFREAVA
jgi:glycosyltransferase involved in cell wall biosynthesis